MEYVSQTFQIMGNLLLNWQYWAVLIAAVLITGPFGLIPGVGSITVIVLTLPFLILYVDPTIGLIFIAGLLTLGTALDVIPAILLGYPGAANTVDFLEGHQLARRGLGARTVGATYTVSLIGGVIGAFTLAFALPFIKPLIVRFSYAEIAAMALFGVAMVSVLAKGAVLKSLGAAIIGLLLATIGIAQISGIDRFTFGNPYLYQSLPLIPVLIGIFALPEIVDLSMSGRPVAPPGTVSFKEVRIGMRDGLKRWRTIPRQSLFGVFMGAIPGIGAATIEWLSYAFGIAFAKDKSQFGKGSLDGVLFTESAQAAKEAGQAIPTLAFGIPGGSLWALMLAAMIGYGVAPGTAMLTTHLDITMGIVLTIGIGNVLACLAALSVTAWIARVTLIPYPLIAGAVIPLMILASFQSRFQIGDVIAMLAIGALGMTLKWFGWPRPPFILAFILSPIIEVNLWTALQYGGVSYILLNRPWAVGITVLATVTIVGLIWLMRNTGQQEEVIEAELAAGPMPAGPVVGGTVGAAAATDMRLIPQGPDGGVPPAKKGLRFSFRWRWEYLWWLIVAGWAGGVILRESLQYPESTRFLPFWASLSLLVIILLLVVNAVLRPRRRSGSGLDLQMRTGTDFEAVKKLLVMVGWIAGLMVLSGIIGLKFATVLFPLVFINAKLPWRGRKRLWSLIPAGVTAFLSLFVLDQLLHVIWPQRFILNWFT